MMWFVRCHQFPPRHRTAILPRTALLPTTGGFQTAQFLLHLLDKLFPVTGAPHHSQKTRLLHHRRQVPNWRLINNYSSSSNNNPRTFRKSNKPCKLKDFNHPVFTKDQCSSLSSLQCSCKRLPHWTWNGPSSENLYHTSPLFPRSSLSTSLFFTQRLSPISFPTTKCHSEAVRPRLAAVSSKQRGATQPRGALAHRHMRDPTPAQSRHVRGASQDLMNSLATWEHTLAKNLSSAGSVWETSPAQTTWQLTSGPTLARNRSPVKHVAGVLQDPMSVADTWKFICGSKQRRKTKPRKLWRLPSPVTRQCLAGPRSLLLHRCKCLSHQSVHSKQLDFKRLYYVQNRRK